MIPDSSSELFRSEDAAARHTTRLGHHDKIWVDVAWQARQMVLSLLHVNMSWLNMPLALLQLRVLP